MDSEDGELFIKQLAAFVRTHEKALANALQFQRRETRHRASQSTSIAALPASSSITERPATSSSTTSSLAAALSLGSLSFTSHSVKSAKLALTPHHMFYLLSRFEEFGIDVGPMKVRLENLHDRTSSGNYVSFLTNAKERPRTRSSDVNSIHSVSSVRSVMSGMSALWASFGIGSSISAARNERQKAALEVDMKYLYSAFTKIPCLKLAPDWRARLIKGYEEFPFDSAVPLYVFKNLQALEVNSIDFRQFFGWDRLADQLRSLTVRRAGIEDPADILIDIVLDDMDKRRRRTSKSQSSPTRRPGGPNPSPRRSPAIPPPEFPRSVSAPGSPDPLSILRDLRRGSINPSEPVIEDETPHPRVTRQDSNELPLSPNKASRPRSNSPSRPSVSRNNRSSHRITRSGSGSSHSSMSDSWYHHSARGSSGNLMAMTILPATKWRFLRHLSLADNAITAIPSSSLAPLSNTLYSLDLSSNLFNQIPASLATLTALRALNLSHGMIDSLQSLTRNPLPAITALNLRANRLQSLAGIERLYPLERLDLRDNRLIDPTELKRLTGIPDIREIWLDGNPFTRSHKDFRVIIFNLFRATPGYTEDIVIDGTGPSFAEKRLLIERVPLPSSVPVVKQTVAEIPTVDINKPAIVQSAPKQPNVLRKERPTVETVSNETNSTYRRRRKAPKRRIVDLATGDGTSSPKAVEVQHQRTSPPRSIELERSKSDSSAVGRILLPPVIITPRSEDRQVYIETAAPESTTTSHDDVGVSPGTYTTGNPGTSWQTPQDWDVNGDFYRRKIEDLRSKMGDDYLSVLNEESWDGSKGFAGLSATSAIQAAYGTHHIASAQAIHSGRSLGV